MEVISEESSEPDKKIGHAMKPYLTKTQGNKMEELEKRNDVDILTGKSSSTDNPPPHPSLVTDHPHQIGNSLFTASWKYIHGGCMCTWGGGRCKLKNGWLNLSFKSIQCAQNMFKEMEGGENMHHISETLAKRGSRAEHLGIPGGW